MIYSDLDCATDPVDDSNLLLPLVVLYSYTLNLHFDALPHDFDDKFFSNLINEESLILDGVPGRVPNQYLALLNFYTIMQVNLKKPLTRRWYYHVWELFR